MSALRLKAARKAKGYTQFELAQKIGVQQGYISGLEHGAKTPSIDVLMALARELEVELPWLLGQRPATDKTGATASGTDAILADPTSSSGLRDLASDRPLSDALSITDAEWHTLRSIDLPSPIKKDGYVNILFAIRAACAA